MAYDLFKTGEKVLNSRPNIRLATTNKCVTVLCNLQL